MTDILDKKTELLLAYTDPIEGFQGFLSIDSLTHRIAAGGFRVQKGLTAEHVAHLARNMTLKQRIAGLRVDGAKSGIDYDPASPGKHEAMRRFLRAIRPYILERYSMGPDLNTTLQEVDSVAASLGITSVKIAIARAQGFAMSEFFERYRVLEQQIDGLTLGRRRAGHGLASAVMTVLEHLGIRSRLARVTIQGFGALGRVAAYSLHRAGIRIVAVSDEERCLFCESGFDVDFLLTRVSGTRLPTGNSGFWRECPQDAIYHIPADVMVPAAIENAIDESKAQNIPVKAVVTGANLGVSSDAESVLYRRGVLVLPDFVAGCGGSLAMDGLFGPKSAPPARDVLYHVEKRMRQIVLRILQRSEAEKRTPREIALAICSESPDYPDARPYGDVEKARTIDEKQKTGELNDAR